MKQLVYEDAPSDNRADVPGEKTFINHNVVSFVLLSDKSFAETRTKQFVKSFTVNASYFCIVNRYAGIGNYLHAVIKKGFEGDAVIELRDILKSDAVSLIVASLEVDKKAAYAIDHPFTIFVNEINRIASEHLRLWREVFTHRFSPFDGGFLGLDVLFRHGCNLLLRKAFCR